MAEEQQDTLATMVTWVSEHGSAPTVVEWAASHKKPSVTTIVKLFGSWRKGWLEVVPEEKLPRRGRPHKVQIQKG